MTEEKSAGLLLQTIPHLGSGRILKVFTGQAGLISLFTKKKNLGSMASPFCIGEWVYKKGQRDLYSLKDASLLDPLLGLRQSFAAISAAGSIAQDILKSQMPDEAAAPLYELACSYFKKLSEFTQPEILSTSFRLKLLLHEGLLSLKPHCTSCSEKALHLSQGESFCPNHASFKGVPFSEGEWGQLHLLAFASKFSLLRELRIKPSLIEKISFLSEDKF